MINLDEQRAELPSRAATNLALQGLMGVSWDEARCRVCGRPLVPEGEVGCWASNCSMRPLPDRRADTSADYCGAAQGELLEWLLAHDVQFKIVGIRALPEFTAIEVALRLPLSVMPQSVEVQLSALPDLGYALAIAAVKLLTEKQT